MPGLTLPTTDGALENWTPSYRTAPTGSPRPPRTRIAYAAAHVVADPLAAGDPTHTVAVDWESTLAFRHHLWSCGLGVAEAMDTAQRGMGLDWATTSALIRATGAEARGRGASWVAGVGTDQLPPGPASAQAV
ncbi:DUF993 family protein, partial [Saccharomonospora saliphila]|uniref:DUF993 family protein n=1 Tax=Saccharomonospora saliphila TaxID=369829 RepID=UPI00066245B2